MTCFMALDVGKELTNSKNKGWTTVGSVRYIKLK